MQRYTFWSNSQLYLAPWLSWCVVRANAKIHILKQFTTKFLSYGEEAELYVLMQRYTFWSNSQPILVTFNRSSVVRANAKIHILKQFTTLDRVRAFLVELYVLMQRYTFWSNSQHNGLKRKQNVVVRANAKIHILKQFTTEGTAIPIKQSCTC